jgi:GT2 family glycosyltransferase
MGPRLGVVSLRLAANVYFSSLLKMIKNTSFSHMIEERDLISVENDALNTPRGEYGKFYPRVAAINGPNVIPEYVLKNIGIFDYKLAPYGFDDPEYCIRAMKAGYINGLFPLKFKSDIRWGGTRRSKKFLKEVKKIHTRNRKYVANKHQEYIYFLKNNIKQFISNVPIDSLDAIKDYSRCI